MMRAIRVQWEQAQWFNFGLSPTLKGTNKIHFASSSYTVTDVYPVGSRIKVISNNNTIYGDIVKVSSSVSAAIVEMNPDGETDVTTTVTQADVGILSAENISVPRSLLSRRNFIIAGNFDLNPWQRGTSFAGPTTGDYTADRFFYHFVGAGVVTVSKSADAPTVAQAGIYSTNCMLVDTTTIDAAIAATDYYAVGTKIEGYDWSQLAQRNMTLSFWHKHTKTGVYCIAIQNSGTDRSFVAEYNQTTTDTWEKATIKISASPSAGTWNYTNGIGAAVYFTIAAGTNFHGTADTWEAANDLSTVNQVNGLDNVANNFRIALVQLEPDRS
jgi:hypothetical protein